MHIKEYVLGNTIVSYLVNDNNSVGMLLYPREMKDKLQKCWEKPPSPWSTTADYMNTWQMGSLAYFSLENEQLKMELVSAEEANKADE